MKKEVSLEEFNKLGIDMNEYRRRDIDKAVAFLGEVQALPKYRDNTRLLIVVDGTSFEYARVVITDQDLEFEIHAPGTTTKHYYISCVAIEKVKNVSTYTVREFKDAEEKPNNIGVLTEKKVTEWISYYKRVYDKLTVRSHENTVKKQKFYDEIAASGLEIKWSWEYDKDKTKPRNGSIYHNGIRFEFTESEEYVSTRMELDVKSSDFGTFLIVSGNDYDKFVSLKK